MPNLRKYGSSLEKDILNLLRDNYESDGYSFVEHPDSNLTPKFLEGYRPDAIAIKDDEKIVIEVKGSRHQVAERSLKKISKLFEGQEEWKFYTYYGTDFPSQLSSLPSSSFQQINEQYRIAKELGNNGYPSQAFLLYWPLLEAIARHVMIQNENDRVVQPLKPGTTLITLESLGLLDWEEAATLRPVIDKRNRLVHGDFSVEIDYNELAVIDQIVSAAVRRMNEEVD